MCFVRNYYAAFPTHKINQACYVVLIASVTITSYLPVVPKKSCSPVKTLTSIKSYSDSIYSKGNATPR